MAADKVRKTTERVAFTEALGVFGWAKLDAVLLGALAAELPVLLIGPHGTAKSWLAERVAASLGLSFRHYNAALVNYDDLVGIPLPDESGASLRFVATPDAIWGAEFVFVDEISRCRPDLQNKFFPIIHERRVAGRRVEGLRHRWAAMNPPVTEEALGDAASGPAYLGSEPLDPALADRFAFVVKVPGWDEIDARERRRLVRGGAPARVPDLTGLVQRTAAVEANLVAQAGRRVADYVCALLDCLRDARLPQSPRRARLLVDAVLAVQAARLVLAAGPGDPGEDPEVLDAELQAAASQAVRNALPQPAWGEDAPVATVHAAHCQAWELTTPATDARLRDVLAEADPLERVLKAKELGMSDAVLSKVVTDALASEPDDARRRGMAVCLLLSLRDGHDLRPSAWEALASLARPVLEPAKYERYARTGPELETWREITMAVTTWPLPDRRSVRLAHNFLMAGFPDLWARIPWRRALRQFRADLERVGLAGRAA